jgi:aminopeptidase YwaD
MLDVRGRRLGMISAVLLAAVLVLAMGSSAVGQTAAAPGAVSETVPTFSGTAAKQLNEGLSVQIGSRPAGSAKYDLAVQYAADQLRQAGYQPTLQTFPVLTYEDRGSQLTVGAEQLNADTLTYSVGGQVDAPLVAAGLGQVEDFAGLDVQGKIALVKRGTLRFSDKVANAAAAGAAGVVVYNDSPGRVQGSLVRPEAVPAVTIAGEDGQRLAEQLAAGTAIAAHLAVDGAVEQRSGTNVLAELPGSRPGAGSIVIGGHLDSVAAGPGANDNASGAAVVLELARTLAAQDPALRPHTIRFALFGAEELGLFGSRYYVDQLAAADRSLIVAMLNLDMVGVGTEWRLGGDDDLVQLALGAATDLGVRALPLRGPLGSASDHASFVNAGIPSVFFYRAQDPNYHTANDRAEYVDPDALGQAGTMALHVLRDLGAR